MADSTQTKHAVILSGGGANGAFEVGVLEALFSGVSPATCGRPLEAEIFSGTSVGSYDASFIVSRPDSDLRATVAELKQVWLDQIARAPGNCGNGVFRFRGNLADVLTPGCMVRHPVKHLERLARDGSFLARDWLKRGGEFLRSTADLEHRTLELFDLSSFVSTEPLKQLVHETIPLDGIARSNRVLTVAATNWNEGTVKVFGREELIGEAGHMAILASTAIPGFFPPVEINGVSYADGGLVMNTPLTPAIYAGADVIHMVYLDPDVKNIPLRRFQNTLSTLDRMMTVQFAKSVNADIAAARRINQGIDAIGAGKAGSIAKRIDEALPYRRLQIHRYHPRDDLSGVLGLLDFDQKRVKDLMKRGYQNAKEHDCEQSQCVL